MTGLRMWGRKEKEIHDLREAREETVRRKGRERERGRYMMIRNKRNGRERQGKTEWKEGWSKTIKKNIRKKRRKHYTLFTSLDKPEGYFLLGRICLFSCCWLQERLAVGLFKTSSS